MLAQRWQRHIRTTVCEVTGIVVWSDAVVKLVNVVDSWHWQRQEGQERQCNSHAAEKTHLVCSFIVALCPTSYNGSVFKPSNQL